MSNLEQKCQDAAKQSQVMEQIKRFEHELPTLHSSLDTLEAKLEKVLRINEPSVETKSAESPTVVVLAGTLREFVEDTKSARLKIDNLIDRLEI